MKVYKWLVFAILDLIVTFVFTFFFELNVVVKINLKWIVICVMIFLILPFFIIELILNKNKLIHSKNDRITELESDITMLKKELNTVDADIIGSDEDRMLLMSLRQPIFEPLKLSLLRKATANNHVLSALILSNLYYSGIEYKNVCVLKRDIEESAKIYLNIEPYDKYGVSDWMLGWYYENNSIDDAKSMTKEKRLETAKEYYLMSADKGYPKAFNSIGKFLYYGMGGLKRDYAGAIQNYKKAADNGDVYGIMNCGLASLKHYYQDETDEASLDDAERYFSTAAEYNNSEGLLQLGVIYEIRMSKDAKNLGIAKQYYIKAMLNVENQYSATAYYRLGKLINRNKSLSNDEEIVKALGKRQYYDLAIECIARAYRIYQTIQQNADDRLDYEYLKNFDELMKVFKNIV